MSGGISPNQMARLRRFVNREPELQAFRHMLDQEPAEQPVIVVWGESGMGKTTLLDRMEKECFERKYRRTKVMWEQTFNHDYLGVMREIRKGLGPEHFPRFTDRASFFTDPQYATREKVELDINVHGSVNVANQLQSQGTIRDITGVVVKDFHINVPRPELGISEAERMRSLSEVFMDELQAAAGDDGAVIFLDSFEKAQLTTQAWVRDVLISALINGRLGRMRIVLCSIERPRWDEDRWMMAREIHLGPLSRDHVMEYLSQSDLPVPTEALGHVANALLHSTGGVPYALATAVRSWLSPQARAA